jgi:hypothetical protein
MARLKTPSDELSRPYERQWERYHVQKSARLIAIEPGLSGLSFRTCRLIDISRGGASVRIDTAIGLPDHYYLNIDGIPDRIGCAEVYREANRIGVKFIRILDPDLLHRILQVDRIGH